ncbi:MAG: 50S ribosomal protein L5 [Planctomycetes bacterium]|nr:50S ribosomal protein L5 [Planctomycetota bacterium]
MARLRDLYKTQIVGQLIKEFNYPNPMAVPKMEKIVISMGVGKAVQDKKYIGMAIKDLTIIAGQKPLICKAKKSVSNFKVRQGDKTGLKVTLRGVRMYEFMDRLISLAIPQVRDFRGLNRKGLDGRGNYSLGLSEQGVFPEIDISRVEAQQGMNVTFVTSAKTDTESLKMLELFGMPFKKANKPEK